jgi:CRP-like cAMP-binding protein
MARTTAPRNLLLRMLGPEARERLRPSLRRTRLDRGVCLDRTGDPVQVVHFPENGIISSLARHSGGPGAEAGMIGYDGFTGISLVLGDERSQTDMTVQVPGEAFAVESAVLARLLREDPGTHALLLRYVNSYILQATQSLVAMAKTNLEERLARWLLMAHDRVRGPRLELTHEFMAGMLGTRRAGVTVALHQLEGKALIRSERGTVTIIDRSGLEELAGEFYGMPEMHYRRLMQTDAF